jgi:hypothetical protein
VLPGRVRDLAGHQKADVWSLGAVVWEMFRGRGLAEDWRSRRKAPLARFWREFAFAADPETRIVVQTLQTHVRAYNDRARLGKRPPIPPISLQPLLETDPRSRFLP